MVAKQGKQVVSIDIFVSRTQSGKTTAIIKRMNRNPKECQNIVVPNSVVAAKELAARIKRDVKHPVDVIIYKNDKTISTTELKDRLERNWYNDIQTAIIFMGNIYRLNANNVYAAQHAVQKRIKHWEVALHVDESDLYIIGHDAKNWVGKDIHLQYVVDSQTPRWSQICFYTATIYAHAFHVFSEDSILSSYDIRWNTDILTNLKNLPYWGYEDIETECHDSLLSVWTDKDAIFNPEPLIPIMDQLSSRDSIMFVHHRNACHDAILHWIQSDYDSPDLPVYCIVVNQEGIRCTSRRGKAYTHEFDTVSEAADWALSEGAARLVWIGDQALTRMQTLRDSENTLPLSKMVILSNKDTVETIIQLVGRMTAVLDRQRYPRTLYAHAKQIRAFEHACAINTYFEDQLKQHGTITKEAFKSMPAHPGTNLTAKRKMNDVQKQTRGIDWEERFEDYHTLATEYGMRNLCFLQTRLTEEEAKKILADSPNLSTGQQKAGNSLDHYRELLQGDPSKELHKRETIFRTPDGIWIDNRRAVELLDRAMRDKIKNVVTIDSEGHYIVFPTDKLGKKQTSYVK